MKTVGTITEKIDGILHEERKSGEMIEQPITSMVLENVDLRFGKEKQVFKDFSARFEADRKYAIIGDSGKGKSTMIKLFLKYFSPEDVEGEVRINNRQVRELDTESLYRRIGFVQKNDFLIEGTVAENILLCRSEEVSTGYFSELCRKLNFAEEFLKKPIEPANKQQVSTGEKQRIDIARFLLNDYDVLVFDEPTSNLDPKLSERIYDMILGIENKMVIVITHDRDETLLKRFDEVLSI